MKLIYNVVSCFMICLQGILSFHKGDFFDTVRGYVVYISVTLNVGSRLLCCTR